MKVIKRNGLEEPFEWEKVRNALDKAFKSVSNTLTEDKYLEIIDELYFGDENGILRESISVEELQDQLEQALFECGYFDVAKSFILYRDKHKQLRKQAQDNIDFINKFVGSYNTADATIDDNSNVGTKGIGVLNSEIHKEANKNTNMELWKQWLNRRYPDFNVKQMDEDFNTILYPHDSSSQVMMPYCMAVSMYPFLLNGLKELGGKSAVPKNIDSFCGIYVNLVFALASEVKGAVATPEFLMYMDYFCRKEWGDDYYENEDKNISLYKVKTIGKQIDQYFQQVTYSINQVAGSRGCQSPFTNFSFFDKNFFNGMFGDFVFPDGTKPMWESTNWLQKRYLHWLNQERLKCILTFPVCSYACLVNENGDFLDTDTYDFICKEYSEGNSFFTYLSDSVDSLSSCCRLQNSVQNNTFSTTNGQMGVMTGSKNVITLNISRIIQDWSREYKELTGDYTDLHVLMSPGFESYMIEILDRVYKYHETYNDMLHWAKNRGLFLAYNAGFIDLDKQYLTIGINGLNQGAEFLGIKCRNNNDYKDYCNRVLSIIKEQNRLHKTKKTNYNCEQVPAESAAIKLYNRDKRDGYWVPKDTNLYASYIFKPNDPEVSVLDKMIMHGSKFSAESMDGGSACHINLEEHLTEEQYRKLLTFAAKNGCKYFTFNVPNCECDDCGYIAKQPFEKCPQCGSENISLYDRIIGYLTKIKNWSEGRRTEQKTRVYSKNV